MELLCLLGLHAIKVKETWQTDKSAQIVTSVTFESFCTRCGKVIDSEKVYFNAD